MPARSSSDAASTEGCPRPWGLLDNPPAPWQGTATEEEPAAAEARVCPPFTQGEDGMKRKLLLLALALGFAPAPVGRAAEAPPIPGLDFGLCRDPEIEAYYVASEFYLFGNTQICEQICKLRRTKCVALVKLDWRCLIEVDKTEYGYFNAECELVYANDKQGLKDCLNENKQALSDWSDVEDSLGQQGLDNCDSYYDTCISDCSAP
jgi:hypothetical protein